MIQISTDKNNTALELFGKRGATAAIILAENSDEADLLTTRYENAAGAAKRMADIMRDNLTGDADKARSALEGLSINLVEKLNPFLRQTVQGFTSFVGVLNELAKVDPTEQIREEQAELNLLVRSIASLNQNNEIRKDLLLDLQTEYPDFLKNLNTETTTNEELLIALRNINIEYQRRIEISVLEEEIAEKTAQGAEAFRQQRDIVLRVNDAYSKYVENQIENATFQDKLNALQDKSQISMGVIIDQFANLEDVSGGVTTGTILRGIATDAKKAGEEFNTLDDERKELQDGYAKLLKEVSLLKPITDDNTDSLNENTSELDDNTDSLTANEEAIEARIEASLKAARFAKKEKIGEAAIDAQIAEEQRLFERRAELAKATVQDKELLAQELLRIDEEAINADLERLQGQIDSGLLLEHERIAAMQELKDLELELEINNTNQTELLEKRKQQAKLKTLQVVQQIFGKESILSKIAFAAEKAFAISKIWRETFIANAKAVAASPLTAGQPWVSINTRSAVVSTALIAAQAIKGFKKGTKGKYDTPDTFRVGEGDKTELIVDKKGGITKIDKETIVSGMKGSMVVSNPELKAMANQGSATAVNNTIDTDKIISGFAKHLKKNRTTVNVFENTTTEAKFGIHSKTYIS